MLRTGAICLSILASASGLGLLLIALRAPTQGEAIVICYDLAAIDPGASRATRDLRLTQCLSLLGFDRARAPAWCEPNDAVPVNYSCVRPRSFAVRLRAMLP